MTTKARIARLLCLLAIVITSVGAFAKDVERITTANYALADQWKPDQMYDLTYTTATMPHWLPNSDKFWYTFVTADGRKYWLVDPEKESRTLLFDRDKLATELALLSGEEVDGTELRLNNLTVSEDTSTLSFELREYKLNYDRFENVVTPTGSVSKPVDWANISPDGQLCLFARGHNLFLMRTDDPDSTETQLSFDGERGLGWTTTLELIDNNNLNRRRVEVLWSEDSQHFGVLRADAREVEDLWLVDHLTQPRPTLKTFKYSMPGEKVPQWQVWLYSLSSNSLQEIDIKRWPDQTMDELFTVPAWWSNDSKTLFFVRRSRDYKKVDLCAIDVKTGNSRLILEERIAGQVYIQPLIQLPDSDELLWWSMRDGQGHYYLLDKDGTIKNQVTAGDFYVTKIVSIDEEKRVVYFEANGGVDDCNPYYNHLYKVKLDGSQQKRLTREFANHRCYASPSYEFFLDDYSRQDLPNHFVLRDKKGKQLMQLEVSDTSALTAAGWQPPEIFSAKAADDVTDMWGVLYKPLDFDPSKKYPIVTRGYPGRQSEGIPTVFWPPNSNLYLANLGCIVVQYGNRGGTPERGLAYREFEREKFRDYALADKKVVVEQLAAKHEWIDLDRVGIFGSSSGGFMTTSAMLVYPEFFDVGVAMSGPNDPSQYSNIWAERYYGVTKTENVDGSITWASKPNGNIELADQLLGKLFLIYGAQDDNVHPVHLFRMADALIKADKKFDMFMVPGADHSLGDWRYLYQMVWDYFAEHLIEAK